MVEGVLAGRTWVLSRTSLGPHVNQRAEQIGPPDPLPQTFHVLRSERTFLSSLPPRPALDDLPNHGTNVFPGGDFHHFPLSLTYLASVWSVWLLPVCRIRGGALFPPFPSHRSGTVLWPGSPFFGTFISDGGVLCMPWAFLSGNPPRRHCCKIYC